MRKIVALCILMAVGLSANGQRRKNKESDNQKTKDSVPVIAAQLPQDTVYMRMYRNGMVYGDYRLAITAMHGLYALHPDKIQYLDSLALLYVQTQNYAQCIFSGREVLKHLPDDVPVISAVAISEQQLGRYKESLEMYEKEFSKNGSVYANYQIAVLQYALQRFGEAQASLDRLILNPKAMKEKISFSTGTNSSQDVVYKAAAENLMGIIYKDLKDYDKAQERFKLALEIQPDFVLAQNNLDYVKKLIAPEKEPKKNNEGTNTNKNKKTK
jgi:tetratricopeptide (TPR) repeat protein